MNVPGGWLAAAMVAVACACGCRAAWRAFAFPAWVAVAVTLALVAPATFDTWFGVNLAVLIVPLIQIIMFGMGTTLSLADFTRVLQRPGPVLFTGALQFSVMPAVGYGLALGFGFEPEIAAGIILVGSVSGGVASNLVTYLAGGDVALSVTMTACSTVASPVCTPFLMKVLAGRLIPIDAVAMMFDILSMILVPVLAGLIGHRILFGHDRLLARAGPLALVTLAGLGIGAACLAAPWPPSPAFTSLRNGLAIGSALVGVVAAAKLVMNIGLHRTDPWMDRALTWVSMVGICLIIGIITTRSREKLLSVGALLLAAAVLHNLIGYTLGYWAARLARMDERVCRTVAIEVGMQNAGMASGLAMGALQSANAALPPAIFGPVMNLSGPILASWWKRRPTRLPTSPHPNPNPTPNPSNS
ncbi:MAG: bile acid:sodium symporter family protein [Limisphaerales bacterium]